MEFWLKFHSNYDNLYFHIGLRSNAHKHLRNQNKIEVKKKTINCL